MARFARFKAPVKRQCLDVGRTVDPAIRRKLDIAGGLPEHAKSLEIGALRSDHGG